MQGSEKGNKGNEEMNTLSNQFRLDFPAKGNRVCLDLNCSVVQFSHHYLYKQFSCHDECNKADFYFFVMQGIKTMYSI